MGWGVVKMYVGVPSQPGVVLGLGGIKCAEDHVYFSARIECQHLIHEIQKLALPTAVRTAANYRAGYRTLSAANKVVGAMALVLMAHAAQRSSVGQFQIALRTLQRLDVRFFVHRQHHCAVGWMQIEADESPPWGKLRVGADTPAATPLQVNALTRNTRQT